MKKIVIIQARMGSARLKGKVLFNLCNKPMLYHIYNRLQYVKNIDNIVVATSTNPLDDAIFSFCSANNILCFRGDENNVLERFFQCALQYNADIITRITADCPFIESSMIEKNIDIFLQGEYDCISPRSKDGLIRGLDNETFSFKVLSDMRVKDLTISEKEHVTLYMYNHDNEYKILSPKIEEIYKSKTIRLCVDEKSDFQLTSLLYEKFYKENSIVDTKSIIKFLLKHDEINRININVKQREV